MTDALFAYLPGPAGPLRTALDLRLSELADQDVDMPADLVIVARSLADRIDQANASRQYRGFVMLTSEYRAARRDLFDGVAQDTGDDGLAAALAEFRSAAAGHTTDA